jgi:TonB family protein
MRAALLAIVVASLGGLAAHASSPGQLTGSTDCGLRHMWVETVGCVTLPQVIDKAKPEYPPFSFKEPVQVRMSVVINEKGRVKDARPIEPFVEKSYERAALMAVRKWLYKPATDPKGNPVKVTITVSIIFEPIGR